MTLRSICLLTLVAACSFAAGVAVEHKAAAKDIESHIYTLAEAQASSGPWGSLLAYIDDGTPTYGTSSMLTVQLELLPGKQLHPAHQHADEEFQYIAEGSGTWSLNGKESPAKKGDVMYSKPWDMHGLTNTGTTPLRFFVVKWTNKGVTPAIKPEK